MGRAQSDARRGSFKVNLHTGKWSDFATGERGGDLVSLAAFIFGLRQNEAALKVAEMLGSSLMNGDPFEPIAPDRRAPLRVVSDS